MAYTFWSQAKKAAIVKITTTVSNTNPLASNNLIIILPTYFFMKRNNPIITYIIQDQKALNANDAEARLSDEVIFLQPATFFSVHI